MEETTSMEDTEAILDQHRNTNEVMMNGDVDVAVEEVPKFVVKASHEAKIRELLCNINSTEVKICSYASKEFVKLLKGETGAELLQQYVRSSSNCSELLEAWKIQLGKPGMSYIVSLVSAILNHSSGKYEVNDHAGRIGISRVLDKFASLIVKEKLEDVYKELNSKEPKRQNAGLLLMASIVRRGSGLASEVANSFNFKLPGFSKLAEFKNKPTEKKRKDSTRKSFVWFAMSFLEVGKPGLLRGIIQQKEMYSGVLRGLGNDDDETIDYVLSTLRDRVLIPESLVRPSLRSVLFGSATLELLASISGRENGGQVTELAHQVLIMACTDPCNGLMPDLKMHPNPMKGNLKRLLDLMKKLRPTEVVYHKDLLLAIVTGRPSFGSAYLDEFPYNLEDHASPSWFAAVCLAANLVSAVGTGISFGPLHSFDSSEVHSFMKCICPRPFSRSVINKGLLHSDNFVKHGTLRVLLESLKLLDSLIGVINNSSCSDYQKEPSWASFKQEIQNEVQTLLPDPQVLLKLISSLTSHSKAHQASLKRKSTADLENIPKCSGNDSKKLKTNIINEDTDIIIGGISSDPDISLPGDCERVPGTLNEDESDHHNRINVIGNIWGLHETSISNMTLKDAELYFHAKLLDALKIYLRTMPNVLEGSFDFFIDLLSSPLTVPTNLLRSLLSLLMEYIGWPYRSNLSKRTPPLMYKHLHPFINLLLLSTISNIRDQADGLARAAMLSTGAFDRNLLEIGAWFLFLPGYGGVESSIEMNGIEVFQKLSPVVVSFLCDAISTVGNNLFKYWDLVRYHIYNSKAIKDMSPDFSPLIVCVLQKCLRLLNSETGTFTIPEKTIISSYTCNTLRYILQSQVDAVLLSSLIDSVLSEGLKDHSFIDDHSGDGLCEWRPLRNLWLFSQGISRQQPYSFISFHTKPMHVDTSFANTLGEVQRVLRSRHVDGLAGITKAFSSAIICTTPDEILRNFPLVISISHRLLGVPFSFLSSTIFLKQSLLADVSKLWPDMFFGGLEMVLSMSLHDGRTCYNPDFDASEYASVAFSSFLKLAPFHVLLPIIMRIDNQHLLQQSKIQDLLLAKLCGSTTDYLSSSLRFVLFWIHQIQLSYRIKPLTELEQISEICFLLIDRMLGNLLKPDSGSSTNIAVPLSTEVKEVAEAIFCHPVIDLFLAHPLGCNEDLTHGILEDDMGTFLHLSSQRVHKMDHHILSILITTSGYLLSMCKGDNSVSKVDDNVMKYLAKVFKALVQRLLVELRNRFDLCIGSKNFMPLFPTVYALNSLIHCISPFELLELVHWMFSRIDLNDLTLGKSCKLSALSVGFYIAGGAFEVLSNYLKPPITERVPCNLFWEMEESSCNVHLFEKIYYKLFNVAKCFNLDSADLCLLKAVNVVFRQKYLEDQNFLPLSIVMLRVIESNPLEIISHSIKRISIHKAKLLFALTELSPLHLSVFGLLFSGILNKDMLLEGSLMKKTSNYSLSDEELVMLLPTALSYLNSAFRKFGKQYHKRFSSIPSVYSRVLLNGFVNWKSYASQNVFDVECDEFLPSSIDKILNFVKDTLLGKAVRMLEYHIGLSGNSIKMKKRLKLFDSICPHSTLNDGLLDCDVSEMDSYSISQSLNFINRVVAKISSCRILLFSEDNHIYGPPKGANGDLEEINLGMGSDKEDSSRLRFINLLVNSWELIVKKFPSSSFNSGKGNLTDCLWLFKSLEVFILRSIVELTKKMLNILIQLQSIPFIEQLCRSSLLYRFEDSATLKMLRNILTSFSEVNFSRVLVLQLLVSHSQFAPTIQSIFKPSGSHLGAFSRPVSSILRSFVISSLERTEIDSKDILESAGMYERQLETIKLLRVLFTVKVYQCQSESEENIFINYRKLLLLLLSSYGATLNEIDLEIYKLMHTIESLDRLDSGNIAEMDYLWGSAALKVRKEQADELDISSDIISGTEDIEDCRRSQFRENLPVDPKLCLATVLYFPYDRTLSDGSHSLNKLRPDNLDNNHQAHSSKDKYTQGYDPVFILRFSIHSLSLGYIEPVEFAGLGLLAVAFVSISSPDNGVRKLGYEALGRFKNALEKCQKRKDVMRLRLLLSYMQNGIDVKWQKIPSIVAIFAAEASFVLLDPSNDHYSTISNLLMGSSKVDLKCIPLFPNLLGSSSVNFRTERLWILRLSYAGLNLEVDAHIYKKKTIFEILLSFYISPLSDDESRELILQILKKSVKLHNMALYLVEQLGLISWLSSIVSFFNEKLCEDQTSSFSSLLSAVLEVVGDVISSRNIVEWLQKNALEQLMELSSHLYKLLVGGRKFMKENVVLVNSLLQILASTTKISQKRMIFQPHFTLSMEGFFEIHQTVNVYRKKGSSPCAVLGLKLILMSTPPSAIFQMNGEKLLKFVSWATTTAIWSTQMLQPPKSYCGLTKSSEEELPEDSLIFTLLRWLTASVIIGKLSQNSNDLNSVVLKGSKLENLQSLLQSIMKVHGDNGTSGFICEEIIATTIFYLQQLLGQDCRVLPSVVSALCLLLLPDASDPTGSGSKYVLSCGDPMPSLLSKILSPAEANPAWRWSYYKPWEDRSVEQTDAEKMDELHACQTLLVIISNVLGKTSSDFQVLSYQDVENSGVFKWERNILEME